MGGYSFVGRHAKLQVETLLGAVLKGSIAGKEAFDQYMTIGRSTILPVEDE